MSIPVSDASSVRSGTAKKLRTSGADQTTSDHFHTATSVHDDDDGHVAEMSNVGEHNTHHVMVENTTTATTLTANQQGHHDDTDGSATAGPRTIFGRPLYLTMVRNYTVPSEIDWRRHSLDMYYGLMYKDPVVAGQFRAFYFRSIITACTGSLYASAIIMSVNTSIVSGLYDRENPLWYVSSAILFLAMYVDMSMHLFGPVSPTAATVRMIASLMISVAAIGMVSWSMPFLMTRCETAWQLPTFPGRITYSVAEQRRLCTGIFDSYQTAAVTLCSLGALVYPVPHAFVSLLHIILCLVVGKKVAPILGDEDFADESAGATTMEAVMVILPAVGATAITYVRFSAGCSAFEATIKVEMQRREAAARAAELHQLLSTIVPAAVLPRLENGGPEQFSIDEVPSASMLFADMKGFTAWSSARSAESVTAMLNTIIAVLDSLSVETPTVEKVKTVGDAYWAVSGIPEQTDEHADHMVSFGWRMNAVVSALKIKHPEWENVAWRVAVHSGPMTGALFGERQVSYEVFGETSQICQCVEANGVPGALVVTGQTLKAMRNRPAPATVIPHVTLADEGPQGGPLMLFILRAPESYSLSSVSSLGLRQLAALAQVTSPRPVFGGFIPHATAASHVKPGSTKLLQARESALPNVVDSDNDEGDVDGPDLNPPDELPIQPPLPPEPDHRSPALQELRSSNDLKERVDDEKNHDAAAEQRNIKRERSISFVSPWPDAPSNEAPPADAAGLDLSTTSDKSRTSQADCDTTQIYDGQNSMAPPSPREFSRRSSEPHPAAAFGVTHSPTSAPCVDDAEKESASPHAFIPRRRFSGAGAGVVSVARWTATHVDELQQPDAGFNNAAFDALAKPKRWFLPYFENAETEALFKRRSEVVCRNMNCVASTLVLAVHCGYMASLVVLPERCASPVGTSLQFLALVPYTVALVFSFHPTLSLRVASAAVIAAVFIGILGTGLTALDGCVPGHDTQLYAFVAFATIYFSVGPVSWPELFVVQFFAVAAPSLILALFFSPVVVGDLANCPYAWSMTAGMAFTEELLSRRRFIEEQLSTRAEFRLALLAADRIEVLQRLVPEHIVSDLIAWFGTGMDPHRSITRSYQRVVIAFLQLEPTELERLPMLHAEVDAELIAICGHQSKYSPRKQDNVNDSPAPEIQPQQRPAVSYLDKIKTVGDVVMVAGPFPHFSSMNPSPLSSIGCNAVAHIRQGRTRSRTRSRTRDTRHGEYGDDDDDDGGYYDDEEGDVSTCSIPENTAPQFINDTTSVSYRSLPGGGGTESSVVSSCRSPGYRGFRGLPLDGRTPSSAYYSSPSTSSPERGPLFHRAHAISVPDAQVVAAFDAVVELFAKVRMKCPVRLGAHIGPVVGTVQGSSRLAFDVFGDPVNVASRVMTSATAKSSSTMRVSAALADFVSRSKEDLLLAQTQTQDGDGDESGRMVSPSGPSAAKSLSLAVTQHRADFGPPLPFTAKGKGTVHVRAVEVARAQ